MIDINNTNNFEELSSIKHKNCDVLNVTLQQKQSNKTNSIKLNQRYALNGAASPTLKGVTSLSTPKTRKILLKSGCPTSSYADPNFLKNEYELARSQVVNTNKRSSKETRNILYNNDDHKNNNSSNYNANATSCKKVTTTTAGTTATAIRSIKHLANEQRFGIGGLRRLKPSEKLPPLGGASNGIKSNISNNIVAFSPTKLLRNSAATPATRAGNKVVPHNKMQQHQCCVHSQEDDIKYIDSDDLVTQFEVRMNCQTSCCQPTSFNKHNQPTKHQQQPQQEAQQQALTNRANKIRPKSTIICSAAYQQHPPIFQKINNSKYVSSGGSSLSELSAAATERQREINNTIDSKSIKASIEKFNNLSKQKRLPMPAPLNAAAAATKLRHQNRGSTSNSGSTSNLQQQQNRYSSEFSDCCNARLQQTIISGGSLTRNFAINNSIASKVVTNIYNSNTAATASSSTTFPIPLKTKIHYAINQSPATASVHNTENSNRMRTVEATLPAAVAAVKTFPPRPGEHSHHFNGNAATTTNAAAAGVVMAATVAAAFAPSNTNTECNENKILNNSCGSDTDENIRSTSALRSALPPLSPTPSRYRDRDTYRTTASSSFNAEDVNKTSNEISEGLCGLRNIGNTCFMNSVIQCLSHTSELTKFLRTQNGAKLSSSSKDQQILYEFAKLIREMWTASVHSVTPLELKRAFATKHRMFSDYNQQDAQEFLRFFLDSLHSALNTGVKGGEHLKIDDNLSDNKKADLTWEWYTRHENSLIRDLFVGQLKSTLKCTSCGNTSVTFDPFWDLSVSLPSSSRCKLDACLDLFIREEILDGDEMPTCSKCHMRRKCTKRFSIQRFPKYLVIHLKRFSETRWSKLSNIVEFPTGERELNMGPYGSNYNTSVYYSLYGISNHMGSTAGGHYVALCKHPLSKKWHEFNDNIVSDDLSENHLISSSAYILFYERA